VNTAVIHNTYVNKTVIVNNTTVNRTSFNGGPGGIAVRPTAGEMAASRETHIPPTTSQVSHQHLASTNRSNFASENHGKPATAAMSRVNTREANQQARITKGVESGQLTPRETSHLENREARINNEVHNERAANGGKLTPQERAQVNHQQNNASKQIYDDKHSAGAKSDYEQSEHSHH